MSDEQEQPSVETGIIDMTEAMRVLEAILFASDDILSSSTLKELVPGAPDAREVRKLVSAINAELQKQRHPFEIVELAGGYQFRTVAYYRTWVSKLLKEKTSKRLSLQGLECLAIIAYKQPISKAEIEAVRGVISDGAMKTLLERHLVSIVGRSDKPGRPLLYGTSKEFLQYFGINKLSDLPRIEEFEAMAREKMEKLSNEELAVIEAAPDENEAVAGPDGEVVAPEETAVATEQNQSAQAASQPEEVGGIVDHVPPEEQVIDSNVEDGIEIKEIVSANKSILDVPADPESNGHDEALDEAEDNSEDDIDGDDDDASQSPDGDDDDTPTAA